MLSTNSPCTAYAAVAQYNASQLITQREQVSSNIRNLLISRAANFNMILDDVSITVGLYELKSSLLPLSPPSSKLHESPRNLLVKLNLGLCYSWKAHGFSPRN